MQIYFRSLAGVASDVLLATTRVTEKVAETIGRTSDALYNFAVGE